MPVDRGCLVREAPLYSPESYKGLYVCERALYPRLQLTNGFKSQSGRVTQYNRALQQFQVAIRRVPGQYLVKFGTEGGVTSVRMEWSNTLILPVLQIAILGTIITLAVLRMRNRANYNEQYQVSLSTYVARSSLTKVTLFQALLFTFLYDEVFSSVFFAGGNSPCPTMSASKSRVSSSRSCS